MGNTENICDCNILHKETLERVRPLMPDDITVANLSDFFKIFGDSTRVKILWALDCHEMCVCDIANLLNMTKSAVSHQLKVLKSSHLVKFRKSGKEVFYSLADTHIKDIFEKAVEHINE